MKKAIWIIAICEIVKTIQDYLGWKINKELNNETIKSLKTQREYMARRGE